MTTSAWLDSRAMRIVVASAFALYYAFALLALPAGAHGRDGDGIPHRWESRHGTNPHVHDAGMDLDDDDLRNRGEYKHRTDPRDADTDDDGFSDGDEVKNLHTDPKTPNGEAEECEEEDDEDEDEAGDEDEADDDEDEEDEDEAGDEDEADDDEDEEDEDECDVGGVIESFNDSTSVLKIKSQTGATVEGLVTDDTELEWEYSDGSDAEATRDDLKAGAEVADYELDAATGEFDEVGLAG